MLAANVLLLQTRDVLYINVNQTEQINRPTIMKNLNLKHSIIAAGIGCLVTAQGATLQIDFSTVAGAQSGWETIGAGAPISLFGGDTTQSGVFSGYTGLSAGDITVTVSNLEFNRRYDNGPTNDDIFGTDLDAMYGDMLLRNDGDATLDVTISGLQAGTFQIRTYHLQQVNTPSLFDLIVTDANGPTTVGNFAMGQGDETSIFNPTIITFNVVSNGTDDIILRMDETVAGTGGNTGGWLGMNGMEIVPEPSTALLGAIGFLALLRRRR